MAGRIAGLAQRHLVGPAGRALDRLGKLHRRPPAGEVGEAERPIAVAAIADHQIEAAAIGMRAGLPGFNLVGIERHLNVS
jgi:hypothetical protein